MPNAMQFVLSDWMRSIDDARLLSELSIPGTHDSLASLVDDSSALTQAWAKCQDLSLTQQLERGRF